MTRPPRDEENNPFDEMFRMAERFIEQMAENMDRMMGPFGSIDVEMDHRIATPGTEHVRHTADTHVAVQEEGDEIRVVADLPGVSKDEIDVTCDGRTVSIVATSERRQYDERVQLPARVDEQSATASYNNGILEVTLRRQDTDSDDTTLHVE